MNDADLIRRAAEMMGLSIVCQDEYGVSIANRYNPRAALYCFNPLANDHDMMDFWRWAGKKKIDGGGGYHLEVWHDPYDQFVEVKAWQDDIHKISFGSNRGGDLNRAIVTAIVEAGGKG